jgi:dTDP-glucose 4,6-dehydratase
MNWEKQTVLVTGGGGFIGSHLVERLTTAGANVRAFVRYNAAGTWGWLDDSEIKDKIEVIAGDIRDEDSVVNALQGVDIVFHLAALISVPYSYQNPRAFVRTNVEGTFNVLQGAVNAGVKLVVHTSSSEVYGTARYLPIDEEHPLQAQSPYAATKIAADKLAESFHRSFDLPVATIRPFNTYGPRQSMRAIIPTVIVQVLTESGIRLGNLAPIRDFSYVADTVEGYMKIAESPAAIGQVINIGSGECISIGDLVSIIIALTGHEAPIVNEAQRMRPKESEVVRLQADNRKAKDLTGWAPQYSLEDGLARVIEWIKPNLNRFRSETYNT